MDNRLEDFLARCLFLDLETGTDSTIRKIGAIWQGTSFVREGRFDTRTVLAELDSFAADADFLLGHNLLGHDLPCLRMQASELGLLRLPVVDTLYLSPLAFPENPYHRLVKDYKLVRDSLSDPVADARLAARVFREQWEELQRRSDAGAADVVRLYRFCFHGATGLGTSTQDGDGIAAVFAGLGADLPDEDAAPSLLGHLWSKRTCASVGNALAEKHVSEPVLRPVAAYATAWLQVAGARSVLPPWVRHRFPEITALLHTLRDVPCNDPVCSWCRETHDPIAQLKRWFGFDGFRPEPAATDGHGLQEAAVTAGMGDGSLLAILPTGGGKSLCFQLPALVRNRRRGVLTIVVSPLQALMKDQVDNLTRKTGTGAAAALYGLLTPPERGDVLERIRLGDIAILYVSPEQLRNVSFRRILEAREIGCWVFDEAHCLSKWGHDFRPDYLYCARFIRELAKTQGVPIPPIACFTATAKHEVTAEILTHFRDELNLDLTLFAGGVERDNLAFEVQLTRAMEKEARIHAVLSEHLGEDGATGGAAIVYASRRRRTEELAQYLRAQGWAVEAFHAGLTAPEKKRIQDAFIQGELQVICATNAFGMGVDKEDVRLVIHADIPGSLENYVQEAGRAGRDREPALCVLLYDEQDVESQFRMEAMSELSQADILEILRGLKRIRRRMRLHEDDTLAVTSGELLQDEELRIGFDATDRGADTRVRIAVAWLERAGLVERNENRTRIFQGRPAVGSMEEARRKIQRLGIGLAPAQQERWLAVLEALMNGDPDEGFTADELARLPAFKQSFQQVESGQAAWDNGETASQRVLRTLHDMAGVGLLHQGPQLSAFLRHKVTNPSAQVLKQVCDLERAMLLALREEAPDAENGEWQQLSLRRLNQRLMDSGLQSNPELLRRLLASLARDGRGLAGERGSLELHQSGRDHYQVKLHRDWRSLTATAERRQAVAGVVLSTLLAKIPVGAAASAELLVSFGTDELTRAIAADIYLAGAIRDPLAAADRGLMFLHEQGALVLQRGLAVFRQAMCLRLLSPGRGKSYSKAQHQPLAQHYGERVFQIHVMAEYARLGSEKIRQALALVTAYFTLDKRSFVKRFFPDRREVLERATTAESFRAIVESLGSPEQTEIVAAPEDGNRLVLAGPGSGKTKVVVHRCAYLLRVARVDPRGILVLCFNRNAALELRRRLRSLVGDDARGVTIQTYHGLAMRITGTSFAERMERSASEGPDFTDLIPKAVDMLVGRVTLPGIEPDALSERLLAGYRHILVDEYQDIDGDQYRLIAALAGRTREDAKPTLLAVGDDDQNIYAFRGANLAYIQRFEEDYDAKLHFLVENYRSGANIIDGANRLISHNRERMKTDRPIRIDHRRRDQPPGGHWETLDPPIRGRVLILAAPDPARQVAALIARMRQLRELGAGAWSDFALLARTRAVLEPIRALCEAQNIPVTWHQDLPPLHRVREIAAFLDALSDLGQTPCGTESLSKLLPARPAYWHKVLQQLIASWSDEAGEAEVPAARILEHCYETLASLRRERNLGEGVLLSTLHGAKGLEFPHVLIADGGWSRNGTNEEERRLYYVGMTRARETLTLGSLACDPNPYAAPLAGDWLLRTEIHVDPPPTEVMERRYALLTPADMDLGYAGRMSPQHPVHERLASLDTGDALKPRAARDRILLIDTEDFVVARLSSRASAEWMARLDNILQMRVIALLRRNRNDGDQSQNYRDGYRSETWEVPLAEMVWRSDRAT